MPYDVLAWPGTYPDEVSDECPEAAAAIDVFIRQMRLCGPDPPGYDIKPLGKSEDGLWQLNLKVSQRQVRVLYAPYGMTVVIFRIHKKSSRQEQQRAYSKAKARKREYERSKSQSEK